MQKNHVSEMLALIQTASYPSVKTLTPGTKQHDRLVTVARLEDYVL